MEDLAHTRCGRLKRRGSEAPEKTEEHTYQSEKFTDEPDGYNDSTRLVDGTQSAVYGFLRYVRRPDDQQRQKRRPG